VVQKALLKPEDSLEPAFNDTLRHPASCAEPKAVSDYLDAKGIDENSSPQEIKDALNEMHLEAHQEDNNKARAPCKNCSQFLARLMAEHGAPDPKNIAPGATSANGKKQVNFTPPGKTGPGIFQSYDEAMAAYQAKNST
jgi:hypothetical protein